MHPTKRSLMSLAVASACSFMTFAAHAQAQAQAWPTRPVRVVEPGLPGGGNHYQVYFRPDTDADTSRGRGGSF